MAKIYHSKEYLVEQLKTKDYLQIAKENNVDPSTIQRWLRKHSLTRDYDYWSPEELGMLRKNYSPNKDLYKLFPNRSFSSIYHKGNRLRLKREMRKRDYSVNENFFKTWGPEMAYVFGWFCSDGNVSVGEDCCSLHLHKNDKLILRKIKLVMGSDHPILDYADSSNFRIYNRVLCADLIKLGCFPRKSLTLPFPKVPDEYLSHFVRGYFDGDGSIHFNKPNTIKVSFIATKDFVTKLQENLNRILGLKINPLQKHVKMWVCLYYGDDARELCHWMYGGCGESYLDRKKERFNNHLKLRGENGI